MQSLPGSFPPDIPPMLERIGQPSATPNMNTLAGLPVELLLLITDLLPVDDLICVSLCSRRLFIINNPQYPSTQPSKELKLPILRRLERDLPNYFICYKCFILHRLDGSKTSGISGPIVHFTCPLRCLRSSKWAPEHIISLGEWLPPVNMFHKFCFLHVQLAMRRFYLGDQVGISTKALSYTQVRVHPENSMRPDITSLFSIDAAICPDPPGLCLRAQQMVVAHRGRWDLLLPKDKKKSIKDIPDVVCHCQLIPIWQKPEMVKPVVLGYQLGERNPFSTFICDKCNTDLRIEICEFGSQLALVVTTWINLGPGLTPDDPQWKIRTRQCRYMTLDPRYRTSSPRVSFENASPLSLEALLSKNLSYIKDKRYREIMRPILQPFQRPRLWYLPSETNQEIYRGQDYEMASFRTYDIEIFLVCFLCLSCLLIILPAAYNLHSFLIPCPCPICGTEIRNIPVVLQVFRLLAYMSLHVSLASAYLVTFLLPDEWATLSAETDPCEMRVDLHASIAISLISAYYLIIALVPALNLFPCDLDALFAHYIRTRCYVK